MVVLLVEIHLERTTHCIVIDMHQRVVHRQLVMHVVLARMEELLEPETVIKKEMVAVADMESAPFVGVCLQGNARCTRLQAGS